MKKIFSSVLLNILVALTFALSACSDKANGTYYPSNEEMKNNLESNGYSVTLYQDLSDNSGNEHKGTLLFASKNRENEQEEYLYFYRLDSAIFCEYYFNSMEQKCKNYNSLVKIENDEEFGNIVYCGTENAVNAAGIKVVKVDVNIKV